MSRLPPTLRLYVASLTLLFLLDCLLYWLDVTMATWYVVMTDCAVVCGLAVLRNLILDLGDAITPPSPAANDTPPPVQARPVDLTPPELRQHRQPAETFDRTAPFPQTLDL